MQPSIKQVLDIYGLRAQKQLSQNFILDSTLLQRIANLIPQSSQRSLVVEIGPGPGSLTRAILKSPYVTNLMAIELDRRFQPALEVCTSFVLKFN